MNIIFCLIISHTTEENYWEEFCAGMYSTREQAEEAKKCLHNVPKFSNTDCEGKITEVALIGNCDDVKYVYRYVGYDIESEQETEIVESNCYVEKKTAIAEMIRAKKITPRQKWILEQYVIDKTEWR